METLPVDVYTCTAPRLGGARLKQGASEKFGMESGGKNDWTTGGGLTWDTSSVDRVDRVGRGPGISLLGQSAGRASTVQSAR